MSANYGDYLSNLFRWRTGRQNPGYRKMLLLANPFLIPFDIYLLKFETNSEIQPHKDTVDSGRHYRLNLILWSAKQGGDFECERTIYEGRFLKVFRPDLYDHSVTRITSGTRYVLSIGWVLR